MEQEKTLQTLIEKAWALQDKISDEIQYSCNGLGGFCPQHGLYFGFAEDPFAQRKSCIAIREALQVLENLLLSLQKLQSKQQAEQYTALVRLEESRLYLLKMITEHPGRTLDVIQDMLAFLRNKINTINWNLTNPITEKADHTKQDSTIHTTKMKNGIISSLNSCFKVLSYPLNLPKATAKIASFAITAVIAVSVIHFHQMNHQHIIKGDKLIHQIDAYYGKKDNLQMNSTRAGEMGFFQSISKTSLDVLNGRG
ncbi:hypothetical protein MRB53_002487 [Persea americana]|uniref:Uncharacterized protein n=1 Tax=Persea americana TaxID=3435 RepID=A0ACC2MUQ7_PERAE|nr:hypothetical protein MRB53_002487 [Persea americana]